jgi:hypothetical protein
MRVQRFDGGCDMAVRVPGGRRRGWAVATAVVSSMTTCAVAGRRRPRRRRFGDLGE